MSETASGQDNIDSRARFHCSVHHLRCVRHIFRTNWIYALPFDRLSKAKGNTASLALRGWQVSGIVTAQTDQSFGVSQTSAVTARPRPRQPERVPEQPAHGPGGGLKQIESIGVNPRHVEFSLVCGERNC